MHRTYDRVARFDERSRAFPIRALHAGREPRDMLWDLHVRLNQGEEGACVGFGLAHEMASAPAICTNVTDQFAREQIYWPAQRRDSWRGGAYPGARPHYEGTDLLSGLKVVRDLGAATGFRWAFGLNDLLLGASHEGPAVLALTWHAGMETPDREGIIRNAGPALGGHCILYRGHDLARGMARLAQSWGPSWGPLDGDCWIPFNDLSELLLDGGEAAFLVGRRALDVSSLLPPVSGSWWSRFWSRLNPKVHT
jgi:hypothetical protein